MRYLLILMAMAGTLAGQDARQGVSLISAQSPTRARASQVKDPPVTAPSVRIVMPNGTAVYAQLDLSGFVLDMATTPPTLRLKQPEMTTTVPLPTTTQHYQVYRDVNSGTGFTLPEGTLVSVHLNGVLQWPGKDYTVVGNVLTLVDPCCEADEIVSVEMRK